MSCVIVSDHFPFFMAGAKAAFTWDEAINKAAEEAEFALMVHANNAEDAPELSKIKSAHDHGLYYARKNVNKELSWLFKKTRGYERKKT